MLREGGAGILVKTPTKTPCGLSDLSLLLYPPMSNDIGLVRGLFCYFIKPYKLSGVSCMVARSAGDVRVTVGNWDGESTDLRVNSGATVIANEFIKNYMAMLVQYTKLVGVDKIIYYFTLNDDNSLTLVDARLSVNKFLGPGMLRDVFGKQINTQEVLCIEMLSDKIQDRLNVGADMFSDGVIIKPSRFRFLPDGNPCYVNL